MSLKRFINKLITQNGLHQRNTDIIDLLEALRIVQYGQSTDHRQHELLIDLYCSTNGNSHQVLAEIFSPSRPRTEDDLLNLNEAYSFCQAEKILSGPAHIDWYRVVEEFDEEGYTVLPARISEEHCHAWQSSYTNDSISSKRTSESSDYQHPQLPFEPNGSLLYKVQHNSLLMKQPDFNHFTRFTHNLVNFLSPRVAGYKLKHSSLVWSLPSRSASFSTKDELAQEFHFDLDSLFWIKCFSYLTCVDASSGPHQYVSASHKPGSKSKKLLEYGYSRCSELDISDSLLPNQSINSVTGPAGTIFLANTNCWHRGLHPTLRHRALLSHVYCSHPISMHVR